MTKKTDYQRELSTPNREIKSLENKEKEINQESKNLSIREKRSKGEEKENLWDKIGIHRSLASFWFNFILLIIAAAPALLLNSWLLPNYILPFPEALGFRTLTIGYFGLFFSIMDFATGPAAERFISQYAEINPEKALHYIQFFIWFQAITGLIQITGITIYCFTYLVNTDLAYAMWFFLIYSMTQFPGMLAAYKSTLKGYQRFDKSNIVDLVQGLVFEIGTQVIFILLGRRWGIANPQIGELMGATIGFIIGRYLDDFIAMGLSMYFVKNLLEKYNISIKFTIIPAFNKEEVRESLQFGMKLLGAQVISTLTDYITLMMMLNWVSNYISIIGYLEIARSMAGLVSSIRFNFTPLISESYNNGKKKLAQYTVMEYFHHWYYIGLFLVLAIGMLLPSILRVLGGNYAAAAWIIPYYVVPRLLVTPAVMGAEVLQACDLPEYRTVGIITEKTVKMLTVFLFLSPYGFFPDAGLETTIILYVMHDIPAYLAITYVEFYFVSKKAFPVKINVWQTFGAGTLACIPLIGINMFFDWILQTMFANSASTVSLIASAAAIVVAGFLVVPIFLFFFFGIFGGWDDESLEDFRKAVELSGPSKFIVSVFYKATKFGYKHSLIGKKKCEYYQEAEEEIEQLMMMKR